MYFHEAMAEAIKKTDTQDLIDEISCKLDILSNLYEAVWRNFDECDPNLTEYQCNYSILQGVSSCIGNYLLDSKKMFEEVESRIFQN